MDTPHYVCTGVSSVYSAHWMIYYTLHMHVDALQHVCTHHRPMDAPHKECADVSLVHIAHWMIYYKQWKHTVANLQSENLCPHHNNVSLLCALASETFYQILNYVTRIHNFCGGVEHLRTLTNYHRIIIGWLLGCRAQSLEQTGKCQVKKSMREQVWFRGQQTQRHEE
jgi:hypothetical protein